MAPVTRIILSIKTILDFKLSNNFEKYEAHINAPEQQDMSKDSGLKTFYIV